MQEAAHAEKGMSEKERILIVDDDPAIQRLMKKVVQSNQMEPEVAGSGEEAVRMAPNGYSLILMDITMEGMDGFEAVEKIRASGNTTPIIIVSGMNEDYDMLYGLEIGADDYITKPFNPVVLGGKIKALIRRSRASGSPGNMLISGPFRFDRSSMRLFKKEEEIPLSSKEIRLAACFLEHPGQVFSKEQLYLRVWGDDLVDENTVTVHINKLRGKLEDNPKDPKYLQTVWGLGYRWNASAE